MDKSGTCGNRRGFIQELKHNRTLYIMCVPALLLLFAYLPMGGMYMAFTKYNERDSRMQTGLYLWVEGSLGKENEIGNSVKTADPNAVLKNYLLAPEKPRYINATGGEVLCIPYSAKNPEGALKFLAWLWGSQDNYLFCLYGEKGKDWDLDENGRLVKLSETACIEAYKKLAPILYGYVDFDTEYPQAIAELEAAGINDYVAEVNRQLEAFLAKNA